MRKQNKSLIKFWSCTLVIMLLVVCCVMSAFAASDDPKDYSIGSAFWNTQETAILAEWDETESKTSFDVTLYIVKSGKNKKIKTVSTSGFSYDFTEEIIKNGRGNYTFFVKPKKGVKDDGVYGDVLELESDYFKTVKKAYETTMKEIDPTYGKSYNADGSLKSVNVKTSEGKVPDGTMKEMNITSAPCCDIVSVSYDLPYEQWKTGDVRTVTVTLKAQDGYKFTSATEYKGSLLTYKSNSGDEKNRTIVFTFMPRIKYPAIQSVQLDASDILRWDRIENAGYYYLVLKDGSNEYLYREKVKKDYADISDYVEDAVSLQLYVGSSSKSRVKSDTFKIDDFQEFRRENQLTGSFEKSGSTLKYVDENGEEVRGWQKIGGSWYYFNDAGKAVGPGWWQDKDNPDDPNAAEGGSWYYFDNNHRMLVDTVTPDGQRVDVNGRWIKK